MRASSVFVVLSLFVGCGARDLGLPSDGKPAAKIDLASPLFVDGDLASTTIVDHDLGTTIVNGDLASTTFVDGDLAPPSVGAPVGAPCTLEADCAGDEVCEVKTGTCIEPNCASDQPCPDNRICGVTLDGGKAAFQCLDGCEHDADCGDGFFCAPGAFDEAGTSTATSVCVRLGTATLGQTCTRDDISTGCASKTLSCNFATDHFVCQQLCDPFSAAKNPDCPSGTVCSAFGACIAPSTAESSAIGASCTVFEGLCGGVTDGSIAGYCDNLTCRQVCDLNHPSSAAFQCPSGKHCVGLSDFSFGSFGDCR